MGFRDKKAAGSEDLAAILSGLFNL